MLVKAVRAAGGECFKFTSSTTVGVPDRQVILNGQVVYVEVKSEFKHRRVSKMQSFIHDKIKALGGRIYIIKNEKEIGEFLNELRKN